MITINLKLISWIIVTIIFLVYNFFFNKEERGGNWIALGIGPMINFIISLVLYLIFWIIWLIIFK